MKPHHNMEGIKEREDYEKDLQLLEDSCNETFDVTQAFQDFQRFVSHLLNTANYTDLSHELYFFNDGEILRRFIHVLLRYTTAQSKGLVVSAVSLLETSLKLLQLRMNDPLVLQTIAKLVAIFRRPFLWLNEGNVCFEIANGIFACLLEVKEQVFNSLFADTLKCDEVLQSIMYFINKNDHEFLMWEAQKSIRIKAFDVFKRLISSFSEEQTHVIRGLLCKDLNQWLLVIFPLVFHENLGLRLRALKGLKMISKTVPKSTIVEQSCWESLKEDLRREYYKSIVAFAHDNKPGWSVLWIFMLNFFCDEPNAKHNNPLINRMLEVEEKAFKCQANDARLLAFSCWQELINKFLNVSAEDPSRWIKLLLQPLTATTCKTDALSHSKLQLYWIIIHKLQPEFDKYGELVLPHFLQFCFGPLYEDGEGAFESNTAKIRNITSPGRKYPSLHLPCADALSQILTCNYDESSMKNVFLLPCFKGPVLSRPGTFLKFSTFLTASVFHCTLILTTSPGIKMQFVIKYIQYVWNCFMYHLKTAFGMLENEHSDSKMTAVLSNLFRFLQYIVDNCSNNVNLAKCVLPILEIVLTGDHALPSKVLTISAYDVGAETQFRGTPFRHMVVLCTELLSPRFDQNRVLGILQHLLKLGFEEMEPIRCFTRLLIKELGNFINVLPSRCNVVCSVWSIIAKHLMVFLKPGWKKCNLQKSERLEWVYEVLFFPVKHISVFSSDQLHIMQVQGLWKDILSALCANPTVSEIEERDEVCCGMLKILKENENAFDCNRLLRAIKLISPAISGNIFQVIASKTENDVCRRPKHCVLLLQEFYSIFKKFRNEEDNYIPLAVELAKCTRLLLENIGHADYKGVTWEVVTDLQNDVHLILKIMLRNNDSEDIFVTQCNKLWEVYTQSLSKACANGVLVSHSLLFALFETALTHTVFEIRCHSFKIWKKQYSAIDKNIMPESFRKALEICSESNDIPETETEEVVSAFVKQSRTNTSTSQQLGITKSASGNILPSKLQTDSGARMFQENCYQQTKTSGLLKSYARKRPSTPYQKSAAKRRRDDIPALYVDLTQDSQETSFDISQDDSEIIIPQRFISVTNNDKFDRETNSTFPLFGGVKPTSTVGSATCTATTNEETVQYEVPASSEINEGKAYEPKLPHTTKIVVKPLAMDNIPGISGISIFNNTSSLQSPGDISSTLGLNSSAHNAENFTLVNDPSQLGDKGNCAEDTFASGMLDYTSPPLQKAAARDICSNSQVTHLKEVKEGEEDSMLTSETESAVTGSGETFLVKGFAENKSNASEKKSDALIMIKRKSPSTDSSRKPVKGVQDNRILLLQAKAIPVEYHTLQENNTGKHEGAAIVMTTKLLSVNSPCNIVSSAVKSPNKSAIASKKNEENMGNSVCNETAKVSTLMSSENCSGNSTSQTSQGNNIEGNKHFPSGETGVMFHDSLMERTSLKCDGTSVENENMSSVTKGSVSAGEGNVDPLLEISNEFTGISHNSEEELMKDETMFVSKESESHLSAYEHSVVRSVSAVGQKVEVTYVKIPNASSDDYLRNIQKHVANLKFTENSSQRRKSFTPKKLDVDSLNFKLGFKGKIECVKELNKTRATVLDKDDVFNVQQNSNANGSNVMGTCGVHEKKALSIPLVNTKEDQRSQKSNSDQSKSPSKEVSIGDITKTIEYEDSYVIGVSGVMMKQFQEHASLSSETNDEDSIQILLETSKKEACLSDSVVQSPNNESNFCLKGLLMQDPESVTPVYLKENANNFETQFNENKTVCDQPEIEVCNFIESKVDKNCVYKKESKDETCLMASSPDAHANDNNVIPQISTTDNEINSVMSCVNTVMKDEECTYVLTEDRVAGDLTDGLLQIYKKSETDVASQSKKQENAAHATFKRVEDASSVREGIFSPISTRLRSSGRYCKPQALPVKGWHKKNVVPNKSIKSNTLIKGELENCTSSNATTDVAENVDNECCSSVLDRGSASQHFGPNPVITVCVPQENNAKCSEDTDNVNMNVTSTFRGMCMNYNLEDEMVKSDDNAKKIELMRQLSLVPLCSESSVGENIQIGCSESIPLQVTLVKTAGERSIEDKLTISSSKSVDGCCTETNISYKEGAEMSTGCVTDIDSPELDDVIDNSQQLNVSTTLRFIGEPSVEKQNVSKGSCLLHQNVLSSEERDDKNNVFSRQVRETCEVVCNGLSSKESLIEVMNVGILGSVDTCKVVGSDMSEMDKKVQVEKIGDETEWITRKEYENVCADLNMSRKKINEDIDWKTDERKEAIEMIESTSTFQDFPDNALVAGRKISEMKLEKEKAGQKKDKEETECVQQAVQPTLEHAYFANVSNKEMQVEKKKLRIKDSKGGVKTVTNETSCTMTSKTNGKKNPETVIKKHKLKARKDDLENTEHNQIKVCKSKNLFNNTEVESGRMNETNLGKKNFEENTDNEQTSQTREETYGVSKDLCTSEISGRELNQIKLENKKLRRDKNVNGESVQFLNMEVCTSKNSNENVKVTGSRVHEIGLHKKRSGRNKDAQSHTEQILKKESVNLSCNTKPVCGQVYEGGTKKTNLLATEEEKVPSEQIKEVSSTSKNLQGNGECTRTPGLSEDVQEQYASQWPSMESDSDDEIVLVPYVDNDSHIAYPVSSIKKHHSAECTIVKKGKEWASKLGSELIGNSNRSSSHPAKERLEKKTSKKGSTRTRKRVALKPDTEDLSHYTIQENNVNLRKGASPYASDAKSSSNTSEMHRDVDHTVTDSGVHVENRDFEEDIDKENETLQTTSKVVDETPPEDLRQRSSSSGRGSSFLGLAVRRGEASEEPVITDPSSSIAAGTSDRVSHQPGADHQTGKCKRRRMRSRRANRSPTLAQIILARIGSDETQLSDRIHSVSNANDDLQIESRIWKKSIYSPAEVPIRSLLKIRDTSSIPKRENAKNKKKLRVSYNDPEVQMCLTYKRLPEEPFGTMLCPPDVVSKRNLRARKITAGTNSGNVSNQTERSDKKNISSRQQSRKVGARELKKRNREGADAANAGSEISDSDMKASSVVCQTVQNGTHSLTSIEGNNFESIDCQTVTDTCGTVTKEVVPGDIRREDNVLRRRSTKGTGSRSRGSQIVTDESISVHIHALADDTKSSSKRHLLTDSIHKLEKRNIQGLAWKSSDGQPFHKSAEKLSVRCYGGAESVKRRRFLEDKHTHVKHCETTRLSYSHDKSVSATVTHKDEMGLRESETNYTSHTVSVPHMHDARESQGSVDFIDLAMPTGEEPIYPSLKHCDVSVENVVDKLTDSAWKCSLLIDFHSHNIHTIGDLCSCGESVIRSLPIQEPKVKQVLCAVKELETALHLTPRYNKRRYEETPNKAIPFTNSGFEDSCPSKRHKIQEDHVSEEVSEVPQTEVVNDIDAPIAMKDTTRVDEPYISEVTDDIVTIEDSGEHPQVIESVFNYIHPNESGADDLIPDDCAACTRSAQLSAEDMPAVQEIFQIIAGCPSARWLFQIFDDMVKQNAVCSTNFAKSFISKVTSMLNNVNPVNEHSGPSGDKCLEIVLPSHILKAFVNCMNEHKITDNFEMCCIKLITS